MKDVKARVRIGRRRWAVEDQAERRAWSKRGACGRWRAMGEAHVGGAEPGTAARDGRMWEELENEAAR